MLGHGTTMPNVKLPLAAVHTAAANLASCDISAPRQSRNYSHSNFLVNEWLRETRLFVVKVYNTRNNLTNDSTVMSVLSLKITVYGFCLCL